MNGVFKDPNVISFDKRKMTESTKNIDIYARPIKKNIDDFVLPGSQKTPFM